MAGNDRELPVNTENDQRWPEMPGNGRGWLDLDRQCGRGRRILCERSEARSACAPRFFFKVLCSEWTLNHAG